MVNSFFYLLLCSLLLWFLSETPVFATGAIGWHWYNEIYPEETKDVKNQKVYELQHKRQ